MSDPKLEKCTSPSLKRHATLKAAVDFNQFDSGAARFHIVWRGPSRRAVPRSTELFRSVVSNTGTLHLHRSVPQRTYSSASSNTSVPRSRDRLRPATGRIKSRGSVDRSITQYGKLHVIRGRFRSINKITVSICRLCEKDTGGCLSHSS